MYLPFLYDWHVWLCCRCWFEQIWTWLDHYSCLRILVNVFLSFLHCVHNPICRFLSVSLHDAIMFLSVDFFQGWNHRGIVFITICWSSFSSYDLYLILASTVFLGFPHIIIVCGLCHMWLLSKSFLSQHWRRKNPLLPCRR